MDRDRRLSLTVGGFTVAALAALAVAVLSLSAQQGAFRARYTLVAYFDNVQGLVAGAAVRLAGTPVGKVERVDFGERPDGKPAVVVQLAIDQRVSERIRADSVARIATVGLLGDQIVEIDIGSPDHAALTDGAEVAALEPFDLSQMVARSSRALEAVETLASNLNESLAEFQRLGGTHTMADTMTGLADIVDQVQHGQGALHSLVYEPYQGSAAASLESSLANLDDVLEQVARGQGVLHSLIYDKPTEQGAVIEAMEAGARLNSILGKIDRGEGTLGLLLNDPTLYDEIKTLVGGANRSTVVRSLIHMVQRDGD
jgi:phospholipid/cholesterol/gamma-HCH transport system substrate-binding protein